MVILVELARPAGWHISGALKWLVILGSQTTVRVIIY